MRPLLIKELLREDGVYVLRNNKYVLYDKGRYCEQLYDMEKDRGEMRNLAVEAAYKDELYKYRTIFIQMDG